MTDEVYLGSVRKRLEGTKCPHCGRTAEGGTSLDTRNQVNTPKPGDFAVCLYCGALNRYTETLQLRKIERAERRAMLRDPRLAELVKFAQAATQGVRRKWQ